jgi:hypothetical protein
MHAVNGRTPKTQRSEARNLPLPSGFVQRVTRRYASCANVLIGSTALIRALDGTVLIFDNCGGVAEKELRREKKEELVRREFQGARSERA